MKNNDTSLNGGNNEFLNQSEVTQNPMGENPATSPDNVFLEMSLGNLNSVDENNNETMNGTDDIESLGTNNMNNNIPQTNATPNFSMNSENDNPFFVQQPETKAMDSGNPMANPMNPDFNMNAVSNMENQTLGSNNNDLFHPDLNSVESNPFMSNNANNNMFQNNNPVSQNNGSVTPQINFNTPVVNPSFENNNPNLTNNINAVPNRMDFSNSSSNINPNFANGMNMSGNNNIMQAVPTPPNMGNFSNENPKEKKGLSKTAIVVIAIVLICVIGIGVYFILNLAGNKNTNGFIHPKEGLVMELGKELSSNATDYADIEGMDTTNCKVDTSQIDYNKMGSYQYKITCGTNSRSGEVIIKDTSAPNIVVKELNVIPGAKVVLEDFIVTCTDVSNCSYELEDTSINLDTITAIEGEHKFNLVVSDDYDNETIVEVSLIVNSNAPVKFMHCSKDSVMDEDLNALVNTTYTYGINSNDEMVSSQKKLEYIFDVQEDYLKEKAKYSDNQAAEFDDSEFVITITNSIDDLSTEFQVSSFPTDYFDLKQFQVEQGFTCKNR